MGECIVIGILINKIVSLALIMALGFVLVKLRFLQPEDSKSLSRITMYLIMPCVSISAFQVEFTPDVRNGLLLAVGAAVVIHVMLLLLNGILKRLLHLNPLEQVSVIYSNAGNLIIPLVTAILGPEWVIYTSGFSVVQMFLLWSHGKSIVCEEKSFDLKKVLLSINMISIYVGVALLLLGIRLPALIKDTMDSVGSMIGPAAMMVTGMLIGGMDVRRIFARRRVWLVAALRLLLVPLMVIPLLKFTGVAQLVPNGVSILMITLLATTTPSASTLVQFAQVFDRDAEYASSINVLTTLLCIATIPVMVQLYQM